MIEYNKRNIVLKIHVENEAGRLVPTSFVLWKTFIYGIIIVIIIIINDLFQFGLWLAYEMFCNLVSTWQTIKLLEYWSSNLLNFIFLEKGLGIVSPPNFVFNFFLKKYFSYYILLTVQISFSDFFYFLRYWAIYVCLFVYCLYIVCLQGCGFKNFEINDIFLIRPFFYMNKMSR